MKPRRVIVTLECQTVYTLAEIRAALTHVSLTHGRWITRYPDGGTGDVMPNRIVQVQVNAIKPEPKKVRWAKFAKEDARLAAADRLKADIDKAWQAHQRKAKRAKGAK